jgi:hypothetical protein
MNTTRKTSFNDKADSLIDEIRKAKAVYDDSMVEEHLDAFWDLLRSPLAHDVDDKAACLIALSDALNGIDD